MYVHLDLFYVIDYFLDLSICISKMRRKKNFFFSQKTANKGFLPYVGGGAKNVTDLSAIKKKKFTPSH